MNAISGLLAILLAGLALLVLKSLRIKHNLDLMEMFGLVLMLMLMLLLGYVEFVFVNEFVFWLFIKQFGLSQPTTRISEVLAVILVILGFTIFVILGKRKAARDFITLQHLREDVEAQRRDNANGCGDISYIAEDRRLADIRFGSTLCQLETAVSLKSVLNLSNPIINKTIAKLRQDG